MLVKEFCEKWWKRIATKEMVFIGIVTLAASIIASWLKQFPGFSLFGALIIALLIGWNTICESETAAPCRSAVR